MEIQYKSIGINYFLHWEILGTIYNVKTMFRTKVAHFGADSRLESANDEFSES